MAKVTFNQTYVGKTDRQIKECIIDPKRGGISDLRKHAFKSQHTVAQKDDFNCKNIKRKSGEVLYLRTLN